METEKEFLTRFLVEYGDAPCVFWVCPGPDEPFTLMSTCIVCGMIIAIRDRLQSINK
jgi:hypothetical protein